MSNLLIGYGNKIDTATLSGGAWRTGYELNNIKDRILKHVARSSNLTYTNTLFDIDLGVAQEFRIVALVATNLSFSGSYRIRLSDVAGSFSTPIYDSGTLPLTYQYPNLIHVLPDGIGSRYLRIELFDFFNPAGYVQIARAFVGMSMSVKNGISRGSELGYISSTTVQESLGGVEYFDEKPLKRKYAFSIDYLTDDEAYSKALELDRVSDISKEVVIIPDSSDVLYQQKRNFIGRLSQLSPLKNPYLGMHQKAYEVLEIV